MSEMLVPCYSTRPHTSVRTTETIRNHKFSFDSVATSTLQSWSHLFWFSERQKKRKPDRTRLRQWRGTAECYILVAADGQCLSGGNAGSCSKVEEDCW